MGKSILILKITIYVKICTYCWFWKVTCNTKQNSVIKNPNTWQLKVFFSICFLNNVVSQALSNTTGELKPIKINNNTDFSKLRSFKNYTYWGAIGSNHFDRNRRYFNWQSFLGSGHHIWQRLQNKKYVIHSYTHTK